MERQLDQDLDRIRQNLLRMGGLVEGMIAGAMQSLVERDAAHAEAVIASDRDVDQMEKDLDEACSLVLALRQPTASDLRFLVAVMKMATDLERMGDSAVNISEAVEVINREPPLKPYIDLPRLSEITRAMVRDSLDSFVHRDSAAALAVCRRDDEVDGLYKQLFRELLTFMIESPQNVSRALHLLLIARNLERIADHATNVAEDVIFFVEGRDIRHSLQPTSG
jgi:phosphate transport system protein